MSSGRRTSHNTVVALWESLLNKSYTASLNIIPSMLQQTSGYKNAVKMYLDMLLSRHGGYFIGKNVVSLHTFNTKHVFLVHKRLSSEQFQPNTLIMFNKVNNYLFNNFIAFSSQIFLSGVGGHQNRVKRQVGVNQVHKSK